MSKNISKMKITKRDWVMVLLVISTLITNWLWYQYFQTRDIENKNNATSWLMHQVEINKLQACINDNIKPCDISPNLER